MGNVSNCLIVCVFVAALCSDRAWGLVDVKSANYSTKWTDFSFGQGGLFKVQRTYNSRSIHDGMFGYGWCSSFETKLEVQNKGQIMITECGGGRETMYTAKGFDSRNAAKLQIDQLISGIRKRRPDLSEEYIAKLRAEMAENDFMVQEFQRRMFGSSWTQLSTYTTPGSEETIEFDGRSYIRKFDSGSLSSEVFDIGGRLTSQRYVDGGSIGLSYDRGRLSKVTASDGSYIEFFYDPGSTKVRRASSSNGETIEYMVKEGNLLQTKGPRGTYKFDYDGAHNMVRETLPDGNFIELTYNVEKDWVTSVRTVEGCIERFDYQVYPDDPKNHFYSTSEKKCDDKITDKSRYEFFHTQTRSGRTYLQKVIIDSNGSHQELVYNEGGLVISRTVDGSIKKYGYDLLGRMVLIGSNERTATREYLSSCNRPTSERVDVWDRDRKLKSRSIVSVRYEAAGCKPTIVYSSDGRFARFSYGNGEGHVTVVDEKHRVISLLYKTDLRSPHALAVEGVGFGTVTYDKSGFSVSSSTEVAPVLYEVLHSVRDLLIDRKFELQ